MRISWVTLALVLNTTAVSASAAEFKIGNLTVETPWSRATPGKARSGVIYLTISNRGDAPDKLVSISTPVAKRAEIHRSQMKDGMMTMRPFSDAFLEEYLHAVGADVCLSVGAYQLEGLGAQLFSKVEGDYFTILGLPLIELLDFLRLRGVIPS